MSGHATGKLAIQYIRKNTKVVSNYLTLDTTNTWNVTEAFQHLG